MDYDSYKRIVEGTIKGTFNPLDLYVHPSKINPTTTVVGAGFQLELVVKQEIRLRIIQK